MEKRAIVNQWLAGHTRDWLEQQQFNDIIYLDRCKGLKKPEIKRLARRDVEEALLDWWREQAK